MARTVPPLMSSSGPAARSDEQREQFLLRLRETFRIEAAEHIDAMAAGVIELERATEVERPPIVERVFREAHSLKGAARSVNLAGAESMCQDLESIFAGMKRGNRPASVESVNAVHDALGVLTTLCGPTGLEASPGGAEQERQARAGLKVILGEVDEPTVVPAGDAVPLQPSGDSPTRGAAVSMEVREAPAAAASALPALPAARPAVTATAPETVRVSAQKLGAILLEADELIGAKIALGVRAAEIRALAADLAAWSQGRIRLAERERRQDGYGASSDLLDSELLYAKTLGDALRKLAGAANQDALSLATITDRLLEDTRLVLLLPCSSLLGAMPMVMRDLARELGKEADLHIDGEDIEVDRRVLDELRDPLIHLLRNCLDHGIERPDVRLENGRPRRGSIAITVRPVEGNWVELTVADDGTGIDVDKVRKSAVRVGLMTEDEAARREDADVTELIFHSGLSTSPIITDLSGRGLGLAIVREKIEKLGGTVRVASMQGAGTTFHLLVPLSMSTFRGVLVEVASHRFLIPTASVVRAGRVRPDEIGMIENRRTITVDGHAIPLIPLGDVLGLSGSDEGASGRTRPIVIVRASARPVAFAVDSVLGEQEVMVKSLGPQLPRVRMIAGASIAASGAVIPILNVTDLVAATTVGAIGPRGQGTDAAPDRPARLLVVEDSITARTLVKNILQGAGYEVETTVDGMDAMAALRTQEYDLVVSDVDMPRMDGFELTATIRADPKLGAIPVVLVTSLGSQQDREHGIEAGANAYIVKSNFDQSNLVEVVRRLL